MNMTVVTVAPGRRLTIDVSGFLFTYKEGETPSVPTASVVYLRREGIIV